jgi:hypothetical protein
LILNRIPIYEIVVYAKQSNCKNTKSGDCR